MDDLLPCPWCGVAPKEVGYSVWATYCIECDNEACQVKPLTEAYTDRDEVISAWNARVNPAGGGDG